MPRFSRTPRAFALRQYRRNGAGARNRAGLDGESPPPSPTERFKIIRIEVKGGKRTAGTVKIAVTGKMKTDERFVAATVTSHDRRLGQAHAHRSSRGGEYAVAEMLGKEGMNLYVWDFGVNPSAPANAFAWKPDLNQSAAENRPARGTEEARQSVTWGG
jgi:hypothetical protein